MGKLRSNEEGIKKVDEKYIKRIGLDKCVNRWFGIEMSKATRKSFTKIHPLNYTTSHISYAAHDVIYLHQLKYKQEEHLINRKESNVLKLEMQVTIPIAEMEYEGMLLDKKAWNKIYIKNKIELEELKLQLDDSVLNDKILSKHIPKYIQTDLFEENIRKLDINWSSPLQCLILFKNILPKLESTNAIELDKHKDIKIIKLFLKYKETSKTVSTYGIDFFKYIDEDERVRTRFTQIVNTGRLSSSAPKILGAI
jgi:DNA polymerase I-like protein with 3'-5' exonuclease and polymerase domains